MTRITDTIRGSRIQPAVTPWAPRKVSPELEAERRRREGLRAEENKFMVRMGLALVSMQEQELDENGHREQTADVPDWRKVARFAAPETDSAD